MSNHSVLGLFRIPIQKRGEIKSHSSSPQKLFAVLTKPSYQTGRAVRTLGWLFELSWLMNWWANQSKFNWVSFYSIILFIESWFVFGFFLKKSWIFFEIMERQRRKDKYSQQFWDAMSKINCTQFTRYVHQKIMQFEACKVNQMIYKISTNHSGK